MHAFRRRTGQKVTYRSLADVTGLGKGTIDAMGSQAGYNATLETIEKICRALDVTPGDLLELMDDPPAESETKSRKSEKKKRPRRRE